MDERSRVLPEGEFEFPPQPQRDPSDGNDPRPYRVRMMHWQEEVGRVADRLELWRSHPEWDGSHLERLWRKDPASAPPPPPRRRRV